MKRLLGAHLLAISLSCVASPFAALAQQPKHGPVKYPDVSAPVAQRAPSRVSEDDLVKSLRGQKLGTKPAPVMPVEGVEQIRERYASGKIKVVREVIQDKAGNYLNHGFWQMFDEQGQVMAYGQYDHGKRTGDWVRIYRKADEAKLLTKAPYNQFTPPFASHAVFAEDKLDGPWVISDAKKRKISEWHFSEGNRHGTSTWWFASSHKMREMVYVHGDIEGELMEWDTSGKVVTKETFEAGRKLLAKTEKHKNGAKKSEGTYLLARLTEETPDDWWNGALQTLGRSGKDEKHGPYRLWDEQGRPVMQGAYVHDLQTGQFTWWHTNGTKAIEGQFVEGNQAGDWTWWNESGLKSIRGEFVAGAPTGRWTWWTEKGKIAQAMDFSEATEKLVETVEPDHLPQAKLPTEKPRKLR